MIGRQLAHYDITAHLGSGGMGEVYQATDSKLGRSVAIKVLPQAFVSDADRVARFEREARVLASLNHANIAAVYGFEKTPDLHFLVMELVSGETLAERIKRGPIPVDEALGIAVQICEALEAAHEKGVVHRDLKPANVKITPEGKVKVLDFGLAKAYEPESMNASLSNSPTMVSMAATNAGMILGTAAYMSPEQAKGRSVDRRTDIFALGCVLFEMLTGKRAFDGDDVTDILSAVLRMEPDWTLLPADTPPAISNLLRLCLEKNARNRRSGATDVRLDIEQALKEPAAAAQPILQVVQRPLWKRAIPAVIAAVVLAVLAGFATWTVKPTPAPVITRFSFMLPEGQAYTNAGRQLVSISPDGTQFVYVANSRLYLKPMRELSSKTIPGTEIASGVLNPVFSPDSQSLAFYSNADKALKRISVSGGAPVTISAMDGLFGLSWGSDNQILAGQGNKGILRVSANGGKPEPIITMKPNEFAHGPQLLPGGAVLFTLATGNSTDRWDKAQIVAQSLKSGDRKILIEGGSDGRYLSTGHLIYTLAGTLLAVPFDVKSLRVTGGPVPLVEGIRDSNNNTGTSQFSVSENGSLVYIPGSANQREKTTLALVDRNGNAKPLNLPDAPYWHPRISPNGKQLAVATDDGTEQIVWIYDLDGKTSLRRLTFTGKNASPVWSADSQRVIFRSDREGDLGLFWQRADGSGVAERLTKVERDWSSHRAEAVTPDGRFLLYSAFKNFDGSIWTYSLNEKKAALFTDAPSWQHNPALSPDSHWVAYLSEESGFNVYVEPFPSTGAKYLITGDHGTHPVWSPDQKEKELFFMNSVRNGQLYSVSVHTEPSFSFGNPVALPIKGFLQRVGNWRDYDITPDGKQFVMMFPPAGATSEASQAPQVNVVLDWFEELKQRMAGK